MKVNSSSGVSTTHHNGGHFSFFGNKKLQVLKFLYE